MPDVGLKPTNPRTLQRFFSVLGTGLKPGKLGKMHIFSKTGNYFLYDFRHRIKSLFIIYYHTLKLMQVPM